MLMYLHILSLTNTAGTKAALRSDDASAARGAAARALGRGQGLRDCHKQGLGLRFAMCGCSFVGRVCGGKVRCC